MLKKQEDAVQSLQEVRRLFEMISRALVHDLKSPLGGLIGIVDLMREDCVAQSLTFDQVDEYIEMMGKSTDRLIAIVDSILLITKIGLTEEITVEPIDLLNIIRRAKQRVLPELALRGGRLSTPKQCPETLGSIMWAGEIIVNLMSNAVKYGGTPPVVIVDAFETGDGFVKLTVTDNGRGIPENEKQTIFEPQNHTRLKVDGLGIGLAFAKQIAQRLGGDLGVEDGPTGGACFWVRLPAVTR